MISVIGIAREAVDEVPCSVCAAPAEFAYFLSLDQERVEFGCGWWRHVPDGAEFAVSLADPWHDLLELMHRHRRGARTPASAPRETRAVEAVLEAITTTREAVA